MIDMTKQYTYQGKAVRIYADGSDTAYEYIHCAINQDDGWIIATLTKDQLVEVWEPTNGELVWCWDYEDTLPSLRRYDKHRIIWDHYAPFIGKLPEAFKGL